MLGGWESGRCGEGLRGNEAPRALGILQKSDTKCQLSVISSCPGCISGWLPAVHFYQGQRKSGLRHNYISPLTLVASPSPREICGGKAAEERAGPGTCSSFSSLTPKPGACRGVSPTPGCGGEAVEGKDRAEELHSFLWSMHCSQLSLGLEAVSKREAII